MASNYPISKDSLIINQPYQDGVSIFQASELNNIQAAIDALQAKVGITDSVDADSIDYKINRVGQVMQVAYTIETSIVIGSTIIYADSTVPQNTEGFQVMTCAITPKATSNLLRIDVICQLSHSNGSAGGWQMVMLCQDDIANALAVACTTMYANWIRPISVSHVKTAGSLSEQTYKVRIGASIAGNMYLNRDYHGNNFGSKLTSSIIITEIKA